MAIDSVSPLTAIQALLVGLRDGGGNPILKAVDIGVPTTIGNTVGAYVALAGQRVKIKTQGSIIREADYYVGLCYQVVGAPSGAELALAAALDAFIKAVYADLTLGGLTGRLDLNLAVASTPIYQTIAAQEYRTMPAILTLVQYDTYNVTP